MSCAKPTYESSPSGDQVHPRGSSAAARILARLRASSGFFSIRESGQSHGLSEYRSKILFTAPAAIMEIVWAERG